MNLVTALAIVIGALSVLITWLFFGPLYWPLALGGLHRLGKLLSLRRRRKRLEEFAARGDLGRHLRHHRLRALELGRFCGGLGGLAAPVAVGATVGLMVLGAHIPLFSAIPAAVYGYAATAAFGLMGNHVGDALSMGPMASPALNIIASMVIGGIFGYVSEKIAGMLTGK